MRRPYQPIPPVIALLALSLLGCDREPPSGSLEEERRFLDTCTIPVEMIIDGGVGRGGIPALTDPRLVAADHPEAAYLVPEDRVIGFEVGDRAYAVPHNIMWWHEIVNFDFPEIQLLVTFCPLTGSSLVFDRANADGAEFEVSGLLFRTNLMMADRTGEPSLWPQLARGARCGLRGRVDLDMYPAIETTWMGWTALHPDTRVVSSETGFRRNYTRSPYLVYLSRPEPFVSLPVDPRRPAKERVFGLVIGTDGGWAFPWGELETQERRAIQLDAFGGTVILWDRTIGGAAAFRTALGGRELSFTPAGDGFIDDQTGSTWRLDGLATAGPLAGSRLRQIAEGYTALWFAWELFQPETVLWSG